MKIKSISLITSLIFVFLHSFGQLTINENKKLAHQYLDARNEVYFSFTLQHQNKIQEFANLFSIDRIEKNDEAYTVYAYANAKQFRLFENLNIDFETLTPPSMVYKAIMSDDVKSMKNWDSYPTYNNYVQMMHDFADEFPEICKLENIGSSVEDRDILVVKISDNVETDEGEPEFYYTSTMHGDETTGYILMLRLIDYILNNYHTNQEITEIVDNVELWINPLSNPDGTYAGGNATVNGATRYNANGVDLNRNFPDAGGNDHPDGNATQPENIVQMDFMDQRDFVMSSNIHGGEEVLNYPWDTWSRRHADDAWFQYTCHEYADTVHTYAPSGYLDGFDNGITNGYDWYSIDGGRQDYMTYFLHGREVTLEISSVKNPPGSSLPNYWNYNYRSLINYIKQCRYGIHGTVYSANSKNPVQAFISIAGHDVDSSQIYASAINGDYHRLLDEGTWDLTYSANGFDDIVINDIEVNYHEISFVDIFFGGAAEEIDISGNITDLTGNPLQEATVELNGNTSYTANTDTNGYYEIPGVTQGSYELTITKFGYQTEKHVEYIYSGNNQFNEDLNGFLSISGMVSDGTNGQPVNNARVEFPDVPVDPQYTDENGEFTLSGILAGQYAVRISKENYAAVMDTISVSQSTASFMFQLFPGELINFETEDFSQGEFEFDGAANWFVENTTVYDGSYAAQSGDIGDEQQSTLLLNVDLFMDGELSFYKKVSSESGWDFFRFYIDDDLMGEWSGEVNWSLESYPVAAGVHTLKWDYVKDYSVSNGSDAAWIDLINLPMSNQDINFPPFFETLPAEEAMVDIAYRYNIGVNDLNTEDTIGIFCSTKPDWLSFENTGTSTAIISGTPGNDDIGIDTVILMATDQTDSVYQQFTIEILPNYLALNNSTLRQINIYPSPVKNNIKLTFSSPKENIIDLQIRNLLGQVMHEEKLPIHIGENQYQADISSLPVGMYLLTLSGMNQLYYKHEIIKIKN